MATYPIGPSSTIDPAQLGPTYNGYLRPNGPLFYRFAPSI